ncbi:MAG: molybdopterin molybdotransferase MoeA [Gemmatimonadota bacterium]|nr:MAG: molybdopterin molybdotransferase MoeA [Gemmatimonadota bacterium]
MTGFETLRADWLTVEEALERVLAAAKPLASEMTSLDDALGRALAENLRSPVALPPWNSSAMDGYAVRSDDVRGATADDPVSLPVSGHILAGPSGGLTLEAGNAIRIMTGGAVPPGADSVIRVEHTDREEGSAGTVRIRHDDDVGRHVRPGGLDCAAGDVMLERGVSLTPGRIGVAAGMGASAIPVGGRPTVAILANGDELAELGDFGRVLDGSAIPESNSHTLRGASLAAGCLPLRLGIARDSVDDLREHIERAMNADALVTIAGASMGEGDLIKRVLLDLGYQLDFWRVKIRPGSPFSFGHIPRDGAEPLPVFGLPGNPASSFVTFELFVRPFLLKLAGHRAIHRLVLEATAGEDLSSTRDLTHFLRVTLSEDGGDLTVHLTGLQGSGLMNSLGRAEGLAVVPDGVEKLRAGERVRVVILDDRPAWGSRASFMSARADLD